MLSINCFKIKSFYLYILSFCIGSFCIAQKNINFNTENFVSINPQLHNYQLEKFYFHTNKSSYYAGEKLYFKAYIVNDFDNKPSIQTTNLHLNVYDSKRNLLLSQLSLASNGSSNGEIVIPKDFKPGIYFIELDTQWNQNFSNNSSIFTFEILGEQLKKLENNNEQSNKKNELKIEFFSDSSVLVENLINYITFKASTNAKPLEITGTIIDNTTRIIVSKFKSNVFGMGRFKFLAKPNRTYSAIVKYNDTEKIIPIQNIKNEGFLIIESKKSTIDSLASFTLKTNEKTLHKFNNKTVVIVHHRNGVPNSIIPIKITESFLNYKFSIPKKNLLSGVNTISLFNEKNEVISEYSFYNFNYKTIDLEVTKLNTNLDSTTIDIRQKNGVNNANLSISILPQKTKTYNTNTTIISSFLLAPYLEKTLLHLPNFYQSDNPKINIDYLIKTTKKNQTFPLKFKDNNISLPENGMTIKGNVSSNIKDLTSYKIMLSSEENGLLLIEPVGQSNSFSFENLVLSYPSKYKLALLDKSGKIVKTGFRIKNELISYQPKKKLLKEIEFSEFLSTSNSNEDINIDYSPTFFDDVNLLETVNLSKKQKREEKLKKLGIKKEILNNGFSNLYIIEQDQGLITVYDYLYRIPGIEVFGSNPNKEFTIRSIRGQGSFQGNNNMTIFVDGVLSDTEYLASRTLDDFIAINVNSSGAGAGAIGMGGVINFYTKQGKYAAYKTVTNKDIFVSETSIGFNLPTKFENSQLSFINKISKEYFDTVGWFPNFNIKPNSKNHLTFYNNEIENFKIIINGIDTEGHLIFKIIDL